MVGSIKIAGISWYTAENYAAAREIMADKHVLAPIYEDWRKKAEASVQKWEASGFRVVRVYIKAEEFRAWCLARDLDIDAKARIRFANEAAFTSAQN
jgi:hypothetical protein